MALSGVLPYYKHCDNKILKFKLLIDTEMFVSALLQSFLFFRLR